MVLTAQDELRHQWDDYYWRESLYFNFADAQNELGAWIYLWVLPNQPLKSGMLVSFYHGLTERLDANELAMASLGHLYRGRQGNWVYCYKQDVPELLASDFDQVELCGLQLRRSEPLQRYQLAFEDGRGSWFSLEARFMTRPWDYADGLYPTPEWVAKNRYHRCWWAKGQLCIAGQLYHIDTTGDSDHSWGRRDPRAFARNNFKMWSFQRPDGSLSVSVIEQGQPGAEAKLGFVALGSDLQSVAAIAQRSRYSRRGLQEDIHLQVRDAKGRSLTATMARMFAAIGSRSPSGSWGFEGAGVYQVQGYGPCTGISSYFWPREVTPQALREGGG